MLQRFKWYQPQRNNCLEVPSFSGVKTNNFVAVGLRQRTTAATIIRIVTSSCTAAVRLCRFNARLWQRALLRYV